MSFGDDVRRFALKADGITKDVFANVVSATKESITDGSAVTGSPGQPVGQYGPGYHQGEVGGTLKASWQVEFESPTSALISTNLAWALPNEYGVTESDGPYRQRSTEGGRHSVALTRASFGLLVADEARKAGA